MQPNKTTSQETAGLTTRTLLAATLPAYLAPALMSWTSAQVTGDTRLAHASYTTIAVPSALAALLITWLCSRRTAPPSPLKRASAYVAFVAAIASCGTAIVLSAVVIALGYFDQSLLGDAGLSAAIGGGIAAGTWHRSNRRTRRAAHYDVGAALLLIGMASTTASCARSHAQLPSPMAGLQVMAPVGVHPSTWSRYLDIADLCTGFSKLASREAQHASSRADQGALVSSVAGILGLASGVTGAVLAARADTDSDAAALSKKTGATAMAFGILASAGGFYAGRKHARRGRASQSAARIRGTISRHSLEALSSASDASVESAGVSLALACAAEARALPSLRSLPVPRSSRKGTAIVAEALATTDEANALKTRLFPSGATL